MMLKDFEAIIDKLKKCIYHINMGDCSHTIETTEGKILETNGGKCVLHVNDIFTLGKLVSEVVSNSQQPPRSPDVFDYARSRLQSEMRKKYDEHLSEKEHSWIDMRVSDLFGFLLQEEFDELLEALRECNPQKAMEELTDIANFCAMLLYRLEKQ